MEKRCFYFSFSLGTFWYLLVHKHVWRDFFHLTFFGFLLPETLQQYLCVLMFVPLNNIADVFKLKRKKTPSGIMVYMQKCNLRMMIYVGVSQ